MGTKSGDVKTVLVSLTVSPFSLVNQQSPVLLSFPYFPPPSTSSSPPFFHLLLLLSSSSSSSSSSPPSPPPPLPSLPLHSLPLLPLLLPIPPPIFTCFPFSLQNPLVSLISFLPYNLPLSPSSLKTFSLSSSLFLACSGNLW